jgi:hypothetical protein
MEPPMADRTKIRIGPGLLKSAVVGSTEPADLAATWAVAWTDLGYTEEGTTFTISPSFEDVEVAEEIDPIDILPVGREMTVEFALAELTAENLQKVLNGGTITTGTGQKTFEPAAASATPTYLAIGWEDTLATHKERYVWRRCIQTGDIEIQRRKAPDKAVLGASFRVALPSSGAPFKYYVSDT